MCVATAAKKVSAADIAYTSGVCVYIYMCMSGSGVCVYTCMWVCVYLCMRV